MLPGFGEKRLAPIVRAFAVAKITHKQLFAALASKRAVSLGPSPRSELGFSFVNELLHYWALKRRNELVIGVTVTLLSISVSSKLSLSEESSFIL